MTLRGPIALVLLLGAAGLAQGETAQPALTVFAAADLQMAFGEIKPLFEKAAGARVTLVMGSTGNLAKQIEHGAPADVFFAANESFIDGLKAAGAIIPETRAFYAQAGIVALSVVGVPGIAHVPVDPKLYTPLNQVAAVVKRSTRPDLAAGFIQFVNGPEGRPIMKRYGFLLPGDF